MDCSSFPATKSFFHVPARTVTSESCCFSCMMAFSFSSKVSWVAVAPNDPCRGFNELELFFWSQNKTTNGLFVALGVEFYFKSIWSLLRKEHLNSTWKRGSQSRAIFCSIKLWKHQIWQSQPCKWVCGQRPSSFAQCDVLGPLPAGAFFCLYRRANRGKMVDGSVLFYRFLV